MANSDPIEQGHRLRRARLNRGFTNARKAAAYFGWAYSGYAQHEQGKRGLSRASKKYAEAFRVSEAWLLTGEGDGPDNVAEHSGIPLVSWISASQLDDVVAEEEEIFRTLDVTDLGSGDWIALRVDGPSMNKISPPDSVIFVNRSDTQLIANGLYVVADEAGRATYKRYEPEKDPPFQPASFKDVDPPKLEGAIKVIGRVRRSMIDT